MKSCPQCTTTYADYVDVCPSDNHLLLQIVAGPDPMLGRLIAGRFLLDQKIGEGGMGTVYKALHTKMDRICAIKLLHVSRSSDDLAAARFNREAKLASRIDNSHAVTIFDYGEAEGGMLYLAMEYIEGRTLKSFLESESPLQTSRAINITRQIASALSSAHSMGIVHRDLKPDNIMITRKAAETDYVKVLDFGIAKSFADIGGDSLTDTGFVLGTPLYMSPEQVSGQKVGERSDVYSLALIVYQMLSGRLPFEGDNPQAVMIKRVTTDPIPLHSVVPALSRVVAQAVMNGLARDPVRRTGSVEDFASQLTTSRFPTQPLGSKHTGMATDAQTTIVANQHPPPSAFVTHAASYAERAQAMVVDRSGSGIEERVAAQAWLFSKFNWKQYTGAIAVIVVAVALSAQVLQYNERVASPSSESVPPVQTTESTSSRSEVPSASPSPPPPRAAVGNRVSDAVAPFARPRTESDLRKARRRRALRLLEGEPESAKDARTVPQNAQNTNSVAQREPGSVKTDSAASAPAVPSSNTNASKVGIKKAFGKVFGRGGKDKQNRNEKKP